MPWPRLDLVSPSREAQKCVTSSMSDCDVCPWLEARALVATGLTGHNPQGQGPGTCSLPSTQETREQTNVWEPLRENKVRSLTRLLSRLKPSVVLLNSFTFPHSQRFLPDGNK